MRGFVLCLGNVQVLVCTVCDGTEEDDNGIETDAHSGRVARGGGGGGRFAGGGRSGIARLFASR